MDMVATPETTEPPGSALKKNKLVDRPRNRTLLYVTLALALFWTAMAGASLWWNLRQQEKETIEAAQTQARTAYEKDLFYRRWNAQPNTRTLVTGHGALWTLGLMGILAGFWLVRRETQGRDAAEELLHVRTAALTAAANAVLITRRNGDILWVNPAFTTLTGYRAHEAVGRNPRFLKSGQHDEWFYQRMFSHIAAGNVWHGEVVNRRKNGTLYTEEMTITPVENRRGQITHFIAIKIDVSRRKEAEHAFRQRGELAVVPYQVRHVIDHAGGVDELLDGAMDVLLGLDEFNTSGKAVAFLMNEEGTGLCLRKTRGHFTQEFLEAEAFVPLGQCLCGRAAASGAVLVCEDCSTDPRHEHHWFGLNAHGHYVVPLKSGNRVLGVINLYASAAFQSDPARIDLLARIGEELGAAVEGHSAACKT